MIPYHQIVTRMFGRPLLITQQAASAASAYVLKRISDRSAGEIAVAFDAEDGVVAARTPRSYSFLGEPSRDSNDERRPYPVTADGTAIITINGSLVNRGAWVGADCGLVSYEGIAYQVMRAKRDPLVTAVLTDLETPGGEAVGCFETTALIRDLAAVKPVIGIANGMAASAGYGLLSGCSWRVVIPSGIVGSIGVVMLHIDISEYLQSEGVVPTFIFRGAHKVDGNPYEKLPDDVRGRLQAEIDQLYDMFVQTVSLGTGLSEDAVRATEADIFIGQKALDAGLVDEVATFEEIIARLADPGKRAAFLAPFMPKGDKSTTAPSTAPTSSGASRNVNKEKVRMSKTLPNHGSAARRLGAALMSAVGLGDLVAEEPTEQPKPDCTCGHAYDQHTDGAKCTAADCTCEAYTEKEAPADATAPTDDDEKKEGAAASHSSRRQAVTSAPATNARLLAVEAELAAERAERAKERAEKVDAKCASFLEKFGGKMGAQTRRDMESLYRGALNGTLSLSVEKYEEKDGKDVRTEETVKTAAISAEAGEIIAARLESIAKALPLVGATERKSIGGSRAETAARLASGEAQNDPREAHFAALDKLASEGVTSNDPLFAQKYDQAVASLNGSGGSSNASA